MTRGGGRRARAALVAALTGCAVAVAVPMAATAANSGQPINVAISNLRTLTLWAFPQSAAAAHAMPSSRSRVVGRLRFLTPDAQAEIYLALRSWFDPRTGASWVEVPLPGRPNGVVGWVPASALGVFHVVHEYLLVNREALRATLYERGRAIWSAPVGVGRPSLPTPAGEFYVLEKLTAIGGPFYGPYAFGTSAYAPSLSEWPGGGVVGIHGTDQPSLIPGRPSHGCIRLRNAAVTTLWRLMSIGTPIDII